MPSDHLQKVCVRLNDSAGDALLDGEFLVAAVLLALAAQFAETPEGAATLADRSREMRALAHARTH